VRFNGGKVGTLWYYRALADFYLEENPLAMTAELNRIVAEIEQFGNLP